MTFQKNYDIIYIERKGNYSSNKLLAPRLREKENIMGYSFIGPKDWWME